MILSDNETKVDMINNRAIAKTIVELIKESGEKPISIGIHGDWGAGKSSILEMVEAEYEDDSQIECIKFNGWQHQGFEDAKIALMSSIVSTLVKKRKLNVKCADKVKKIWKNINWISVAKAAGSMALTATTGVPPIGVLSNITDTLKSNIKDAEKVESAIENIGSFMRDSRVFEDISLSNEFTEFQESFNDLLNEASINKLVVLIDDLDRCLPEVTIETLEAVRLFMFSKSTAFVVAADEAMIEYAVKNHFPDLMDGNNQNVGREFSKRYLEKLIQVPFRLPALGEIESEMYITLLLIGSNLNESEIEYAKLLELSIEKMKKPWKNHGFTVSEIHGALGEKYGDVTKEITIANQIGVILAKNSSGNPRKIKRFINMLLLRYKIAEARGFGDEIQLPTLAKMMLAEQFFNDFYVKIASDTTDSGKSSIIGELERLLLNPVTTEEKEKDLVVEKINRKIEKLEPSVKEKEWVENEDVRRWLITEPFLTDIDLRPYFFANKEREDYFFNQVKSEKLRYIIDRLMSTEMNIAAVKDEIITLSDEEAKKIFDILSSKILAQGNIARKPKGIDGIKRLVSEHSELQIELVNLITLFDSKTVGAWVCSGWDECIKKGEAKSKLNSFYEMLRKNGQPLVRAALSTK